jgi:sugar diacid utilization regulator/putative methionine-R-sulfoxide reductase with GAF domain
MGLEGPQGEEKPRSGALARAAAAKGTYGPEFLYQIIEVISSGPDLGTILDGFVPLVTAATESHGCFIYFVEEGQLVLRKASAGYSQMEGRLRLSLDEGLTGWVARTRRSAYIKDKALEDPRVVYVPEFEEELYQSLVSVPIVSRAGQAIGVITLHAKAPHEFRRSDLAFLENSASLMAGAIENARLYGDAIGRVEHLTQLSALAQQLAAAGTTEELLRVVTAGCRKLLGATRCELYLAGTDDDLELVAASPTRSDASVLDARRLWSQLVAADTQTDVARGLAELVWGKAPDGQPLFAALSTGDERVGLLALVVERAGVDDRSLLANVAAATAVAIRRRQLIDSLEEKNLVKDFFEALAGGEADAQWLRAQAIKLQADLEAPHLVFQAGAPALPARQRGKAKPAAAEPTLDWRALAGRLESRLRLELPRSIFDSRETSFRALLRIPAAGPDTAVEAVRRIHQSLGAHERGSLAIGLSNPCQGAAAIARGFEEAASAAQVGSLLRGGAGVFAYEELGAYRYVVSAESSVRDRYQDRLQRLVDYEKRRGTELLRTLEAYVENLGSIARASRALYMHPNTLRQRLSRIEQLTEFDLDKEDWLSLGMAIKIVKLRTIRGPKNLPLPDR